MAVQDSIQRFLFDHTNTRGEIVRLHDTFQDALKRTEYPREIASLLGEVMTAAALLSTTIKFKGKLSLQLQGNGTLKILLVQITSEKKVRGMVDWDGEVVGKDLPELAGKANLVITIEPDQGERYQGVIPLIKGRFQQCLEDYFAQSEQLPTRIWLECSDNQTAGFLLQRLPSEKDSEEDNWEHVTTLADTITRDELLHLDNEELLYRLFHAEEVRLFPPESVQFQCTCSQERCESAVLSLGAEEIGQMLADQQGIGMKCEFCNTDYHLDVVDLARLQKIALSRTADA